MGTDRFQLVGTCLDGKFRVEEFVAEGGFAAVYSGQHLSLDRAIAIKVLKTPVELNEQAREHFIAKFSLEAKTIARMSHLNIVQVIDFGVSPMPSGETAPWMVLEWLTGRSLEQDLQLRRGHGGRTPEQALDLLEPIFDALAYAHEEGIAHRDVKPANIMIVPTKRGEMLKLVDFGIVKIMDKGETAEKDLAPTRGMLSAHSPAYAAPEQITGLRTGPWTDVHALALILTEVMTDLPPYDGKNITTLLREILSPQRPTPARHKIDAGPWEAVLGKALALEPSERFKNASEFLVALKNAIPPTLKPIAFGEDSKEDYVRTQLLPTAKQQPLHAYPGTTTPREPIKPAAAKPIRSSERIDSGSKPSKWLAAVVGIVVLALGVGYLAMRNSSGNRLQVKAPEAPLPEASRAAPPPPRPTRDPIPRDVSATPGPPAAPRLSSSMGEATQAPTSMPEASRPSTSTQDVKTPEPAPHEAASPSATAGVKTPPPSSSKLRKTPREPAQHEDQRAASRKGRSPENKPLQRTIVELE
jgi:serine/threonine protein kinase